MSDVRWDLGLAPMSDAEISGTATPGKAAGARARSGSASGPARWDGAAGLDRPLALVGPTASGKTAVTLKLAELVDPLEAVAADSMSVYRHMAVGTAAPTADEQARVPHHLVGLVEPHEEFSVAQFQRAADEAFDAIAGRGAHAVLVGGTGLYHQAVLDDLTLPGRFPEVLAELEAAADSDAAVRALHERLVDLDSVAAARMEPSNRRRVVRALEVTLGSGRPFSSFGPGIEAYPPTPFVQVGLRLDRADTALRVEQRFESMIKTGFLDEVQALLELPDGMSRTSAQALGYRELAEHLRGDRTLSDAVATAVRRTYQLAVRQERWFRRDRRLVWVDADADPATVAGRVHAVWSSADVYPGRHPESRAGNRPPAR